MLEIRFSISPRFILGLELLGETFPEEEVVRLLQAPKTGAILLMEDPAPSATLGALGLDIFADPRAELEVFLVPQVQGLQLVEDPAPSATLRTLNLDLLGDPFMEQEVFVLDKERTMPLGLFDIDDIYDLDYLFKVG